LRPAEQVETTREVTEILDFLCGILFSKPVEVGVEHQPARAPEALEERVHTDAVGVARDLVVQPAEWGEMVVTVLC
jgi:hypothetical protein